MEKKPWNLLILVVLALTGYAFSAAQTAEPIRNPAEPHFGEIVMVLEEDLVLGNESDENYMFYRVWDVQADDSGNLYVLDSGATKIQKYDRHGNYLQTIGRQGQGPGEFERPIELTFDKKGNLYVTEMAKIHMFAPDGKFMKTTKVPFFFMALAADGEGNFIVTGRVNVEGAQNLGVLILDPDGNIRKKIAEFPGLPLHETGLTISHDYSPEIRFAPIKNEGILYGYNLDYKLYKTDWSGKNIIVFRKEERAHPVSPKEKSEIIDDLADKTGKAGMRWSKNLLERMADLPDHRPFFDRIRVDDTGRIYIRKHRSVLDKSEESAFDIFGRDGHFLYSTTLPFVPTCIKNGFLYHTTFLVETGETRVVRYRIKNWNRMRSSLN